MGAVACLLPEVQLSGARMPLSQEISQPIYVDMETFSLGAKRIEVNLRSDVNCVRAIEAPILSGASTIAGLES